MDLRRLELPIRWSVVALLLLALNAAVWLRVRTHRGGGSASASTSTEDFASAYAPSDAPLETATGPRRFAAIDVHEHAENDADVDRLVAAMDRIGIERACLLAAAPVTFGHDTGGFAGFEENNDTVLAGKARHPGRICAFVTLHPPDRDNLERLESYVARGADGLKLYLGHPGKTATEPFHMMPLDDPRMAPVFEYAERTQLPITMHVDLGLYGDELERLMKRFPELRVNLPHFGLQKNTAERLERLGHLLDRFPDVFVDVSFGHPEFQIHGFETLAANRARMQAFMVRYARRLMFACDLVVVGTTKDDFVDDTLDSYARLLETSSFRFFLRPSRPMNGLALPSDVLRSLYRDTPTAFLKLPPGDTKGSPSTARTASATK